MIQTLSFLLFASALLATPLKKHSEKYKVGPFDVQTECEIAPPGSEKKLRNCAHRLTQKSKTLILKGGEKVRLVHLPFQPATETILATEIEGCCGSANFLEFFDEEGRPLGKGTLASSKEKEQGALQAPFIGEEFALLSKEHAEVFQESEKFFRLFYNKAAKKIDSMPITDFQLPKSGDCDWFLEKVVGSTLEFSTGRCNESPEFSVQFNCREEKPQFICSKTFQKNL